MTGQHKLDRSNLDTGTSGQQDMKIRMINRELPSKKLILTLELKELQQQLEPGKEMAAGYEDKDDK